MKVLNSNQVLQLEQEAASRGVSPSLLMERAGTRMAGLIRAEYPACRRATVMVGKGNNGGDGLVVARELLRAGWNVAVCLASARADLVPLAKEKLAALEQSFPSAAIPAGGPIPWPGSNDILIDALVGLGVKGPLRDPLAPLAAEINRQRGDRFFQTVSLDLPSGLEGLTPEQIAAHSGASVVADLTLAVGHPKEPLIREELSHWVGRILVAPIFDELKTPEGPLELITREDVRSLLPRRSANSHKYMYGRVLIVGGSEGFSGAPVMSAHACLRAGAGLVQIATHHGIASEIASRCRPEVMVQPVRNGPSLRAMLSRASAVVLGPGLGLDEEAFDLFELVMRNVSCPVIVDADALSLMSENLSLIDSPEGAVILTPHVGEMRRLISGREFSQAERPAIAREFADSHECLLVLKGVRSLVASPHHPVAVNSSGNPGLATGGSGDCLTGIMAALVAQGLNPIDASRMAVYWHGVAADIALSRRGNEEGLLPGDVIDCLGDALNHIRAC